MGRVRVGVGFKRLIAMHLVAAPPRLDQPRVLPLLRLVRVRVRVRAKVGRGYG